MSNEQVSGHTLALAQDGRVARLYIYEEIGDFFFSGVSAKQVVSDLRAAGDVDEIEVFLNSPGGIAFDGITIYNELRRHKASVTVYVRGLAASAASIVAMAGDKIVVDQGGFLMIHKALGAGYGNADIMLDLAERLEKIDGEMAAIYARRSGQSVEVASGWMREETWFNAEGAVEAGLADEALDVIPVVDGEEPVAAWSGVLERTFARVPEQVAARFEDERDPAEAGKSNEEVEAMPDTKNEVRGDQQDQPEPQPASYEALRARCIGADAEFICGQMEAKATVEDAVAAWMTEQQARLEAAQAAATVPGVDGVEDGGGEDAPTDAVAQFNELVAKHESGGKDHRAAVRAAVIEDPELHKAYVEAVNQ